MCIEGKQLSSEKLSQKIEQISVSGKAQLTYNRQLHRIAEQVKQLADFKLSMSEMTFPHQLARIMLLEQLIEPFRYQAR
jgi:23S rRNA (pseudouridine1915-N3)-methyltransferase